MSKNVLNFVESENKKSAGVKMLGGTAQLTQLARTIVNDIMDVIESDFDNKAALFEASKVDHGAMDTLISESYDLTTVDVSFLKELDEDTLNGMLKSQQSKRSRAKSKEMTMDNYAAMMNGAVSEHLLRLVMNKPRGTAGFGYGGKPILEYTPEEIQALADDQDALRRAIRNVQSQKCIMKHKDDFVETDEKYQALLKVEAVLKDLRVAMPASRGSKIKAELQELIGDRDIDSLKAADSKDLLKQIQAMLDAQDAAKVEAEEEPVDVEADSEVTEDAE